MEIVTSDNFDEWKHHPVTKRLLKMLGTDREAMKEGLVNNAFDDEQEVKGRCRAIAIILSLEYEDLFEVKRETNEQ
tara:strand:+ start:171 stop:398 length:228 start_codon:yes stop_codon:yes gene_type:complete